MMSFKEHRTTKFPIRKKLEGRENYARRFSADSTLHVISVQRLDTSLLSRALTLACFGGPFDSGHIVSEDATQSWSVS